MLSGEARAELERLFAAQDRSRKPLDQRRREWEAAARLDVLPREARFQRQVVGEVVCEWMEMPRVARDRVFLLLHGGGFNAGSYRTHRKLAASLSRASHMRVPRLRTIGLRRSTPFRRASRTCCRSMAG